MRKFIIFMVILLLSFLIVGCNTIEDQSTKTPETGIATPILEGNTSMNIPRIPIAELPTVANLEPTKIFFSKYNQQSIAVFIDQQTFNGIRDEVEVWESDVFNEMKANVYLHINDWKTIQDIRKFLVEHYSKDGLIGSILVGDVPTASFEYNNSFSLISDWYFQDLNGIFSDADNDGMIERELYGFGPTDITEREVWSGRLKPPIPGLEGIFLLKNYFRRNHAYRIGNLKYDKRMLYFNSININDHNMNQKDYVSLVNQIDDYTGLYSSDDQIEYIYHTDLETQKSEYLSRLSNSYDFLFVNIHGSQTGQWLGGSTWVDFDEINVTKPQALFNVIASCSNGDFSEKNYLAGWYLFSGNSLIVIANTVVTFLVGSDSVEFLKDYTPLKSGVIFGEMYKNDRSFLVTHLFGDPTLTLRPKLTGDLPNLSVDKTYITFGTVERGSKSKIEVFFKNLGSSPLKVLFKKASFSINDEFPNDLGYWDVFYYEYNESSGFVDFEIQPSESKSFPFIFYPRFDGPIGKYSMMILFQTNDPTLLYLQIKLRGEAK